MSTAGPTVVSANKAPAPDAPPESMFPLLAPSAARPLSRLSITRGMARQRFIMASDGGRVPLRQRGYSINLPQTRILSIHPVSRKNSTSWWHGHPARESGSEEPEGGQVWAAAPHRMIVPVAWGLVPVLRGRRGNCVVDSDDAHEGLCYNIL